MLWGTYDGGLDSRLRGKDGRRGDGNVGNIRWRVWIPACAGKTAEGVKGPSQNSCDTAGFDSYAQFNPLTL